MRKFIFLMFRFVLGLAMLLLLASSSSAQVSQSRRSTLGQGINIDRWLHRVGDAPPTNPSFDPPTFAEILAANPSTKFPDTADLDYIKGLGLKHIRLPVSFSRLTNPSVPGPLNDGTNGTKNHLADLRNVINQITAKGLGVIVCPFNVPESAWSSTVYQTLWRNLAKALSQNPNTASLVFLTT